MIFRTSNSVGYVFSFSKGEYSSYGWKPPTLASSMEILGGGEKFPSLHPCESLAPRAIRWWGVLVLFEFSRGHPNELGFDNIVSLRFACLVGWKKCLNKFSQMVVENVFYNGIPIDKKITPKPTVVRANVGDWTYGVAPFRNERWIKRLPIEY